MYYDNQHKDPTYKFWNLINFILINKDPNDNDIYNDHISYT